MPRARGLIPTIVLALTIALPALAQTLLPETVYDELNRAILEDQIGPDHEALAAAAGELAAAMEGYCAAPDDDGLSRVRAAYHDTYDRWMVVSWIRFGPQELSMRSMRMHFWPDSRNTLGRQLSGILNESRQDLLDPANLAKASIALQGLPVLERLLFDDTVVAENPYACSLATAVAGNIGAMASELAAEWADGGALAPTLPSGTMLTDSLFQGVHEQLAVIETRKLDPVLGESAAEARPRLAENWRSERAMRNIAMNLTGVLGVVENGEAVGFADIVREHGSKPERVDRMVEALNEALAIAQDLEGRPIAELVTEDESRARLVEAAEAIAFARNVWDEDVGEALGLSLGFNRLDGD